MALALAASVATTIFAHADDDRRYYFRQSRSGSPGNALPAQRLAGLRNA